MCIPCGPVPGALLQPQSCQTAPCEGWLTLSAYQQQQQGTSNYTGWTNTCWWFCLTLFVQPNRLPTKQRCTQSKQVKTQNRERSCCSCSTTPKCNACWDIIFGLVCKKAPKAGKSITGTEKTSLCCGRREESASAQSPAPASGLTLCCREHRCSLLGCNPSKPSFTAAWPEDSC